MPFLSLNQQQQCTEEIKKSEFIPKYKKYVKQKPSIENILNNKNTFIGQ